MAFLKVKRKNEEDAKELFILASKRSKIEDVEVPIFELTNSCVQGADIDTVINNTIQNRSSIKTRAFDLEKLRSKLREDNIARGKANKLKVLNHVRKLDSSTEESVPVIDLSSDTEAADENGNEYVYDLYYSSTFVDFSNPKAIEDYCLHEIDEELCIQECDDEEFLNEDEDDSNDENYWKNDYPDEGDEDAASFLSRQLKNSHLNSDYSLSSSELDEDVERDSYCSPRNKDDYYNEVVSDSESD